MTNKEQIFCIAIGGIIAVASLEVLTKSQKKRIEELERENYKLEMRHFTDSIEIGMAKSLALDKKSENRKL